MTKLESIEHKIFASEAPLDEIGQFGSALDTTKLNTKDVTTIQALPAYTKGWGSAIISDNNYPTMEEMNGVLNVMSYHTGYLYQEGIPVWRNDREYSATSIVKEPTGTKLFHSLKDGNIGNTLDNTEYWEELKLGGSGLEICDIGLALYVDETKGLRRYLNGQIVDINTNTQAFLNRLLEIKNTNPDYFTTEDNWQAEALLNIDGCVYKFVLNYSGETVVSVRLPKYPDYVEINAGGTLPVVGNGMTLGITNGSGTAGFYHYQANTAFVNVETSRYGTPVGGSVGDKAGTLYGGLGVTTDPTKSGIQTTLKQTKLKMRYFIQIATGSETEANIVNTLENVNGFTLLESKYSDKPLYNESWLLSNGQYNAKAVYPTAYEGLQVEYNTEIEVGTTVTLPSGVSYTKRGLSVKLSTELDITDYDFVLNTANEKFRLPLKTKLASGKAVVGNGISFGLTDGTTNYGLYGETSTNRIIAYSDCYGQTVRASGGGAGTPASRSAVLGVTTDPTKSGLELSDSNLYLYFYVGDIDQNHGIVNMGRIGEQLATKTDMLQASGAGMPSNKYINLTLGASGSTYTAPANGWLNIWVIMTNPGYIKFDSTSGILIEDRVYASGLAASLCMPCKKNDVIIFSYDGTITNNFFKFIYAEGSK